MPKLVRALVPPPNKDGLVDEKHFLRLLADAFQLASGGDRKRVELRRLQLALLHRGWHP